VDCCNARRCYSQLAKSFWERGYDLQSFALSAFSQNS
jgi:hypothetical protein